MSLLERFAAHLDSFGPWGPVLFIAVYVLASVAFVPGAVLTLAAGAVFGLARAVPIVFIGAVLGSSAAFAIARTVARDRVTRWIARNPRAMAVNDAVAGQGAKIILLLRLSPVIPYNILNYALGASEVRYRDFLLGAFGMLPATVLYAYYGKVVGDVTALAAGTAPPRGAEYYGFVAIGLLATIVATVLVTRAARAGLAQPPRR